MKSKTIRLTERDLHNIIRESVEQIISEGWEDAYDKWADNIGAENGEELSKEWQRQLKNEFPDKKRRAYTLTQYMKKRDVRKGKVDSDPKWRDYDSYINTL